MSIGKSVFIFSGCVFVLLGLFATLLVVGMFAQPGGIGAEKLLGPVIGFMAFGFFAAGGVCFLAALLLRKRASREPPLGR